jgi:hypothetical protein
MIGVIIAIIAVAILLALPAAFEKPKRTCSLCYGAGWGRGAEGEEIRCILCGGRGWL